MKLVTKLPEQIQGVEKHFSSMSMSSTDIDSWKLYYNKYNPQEFSYLTQVKGKSTAGREQLFTYPVKFKWIPIVKKNLNVLISTQELRPFIYTINIRDDRGVRRKFHAQAMGIVNELFNRHDSYYEKYTIGMEKLQSKKQQFQQMLQQEPKNQADAAQLNELKTQMPYINSEIRKLETQMNNSNVLNEEIIKKLEHYYTYDAKDIVEEVAQKIAIKIQKETPFKLQSNAVFIDRLVTGKPYYLVNHTAGDKNITIKRIGCDQIIYPAIEGIEYTHELPWVGYKEVYSYTDIKRLWGHVLGAEKLKILKGAKKRVSSNAVFLPTEPTATRSGDGAIENKNSQYTITGQGVTSEEGLEVLHVWYVVEKRINARISLNKFNPSRPFIHFVDDDDIKNRPIRVDKGEKVEYRYYQERHYGIIINGNIFLGFEKDEIQPRDSNNLSKVYLPIIGETFTTIARQPSSLVQDTKDLNYLYQVLNYHKELYVAVSGVKGQIIDVSQKPKNMSLAEQRFYRKLGNFYIQTKDSRGRNLASFYNQWKTYDDSLSQSVAVIDNMMNSIEETMGVIMGTPRQRVGQTVSTDQVGTNEQAVHMANLVTERLHYEQDVLDSIVLQMAVNIYMNHLLKPNEIISVPTDDDFGMMTYRIPEFDNNNSQISVVVQNNKKQLEQKQKLEQYAAAEYSKGGLPLYALAKIYNIDNVKTLEKELENYSKEMMQIQQKSQQSAEEAQDQREALAREAELTKIKMDIQAKMAELEVMKERIAIETDLKEKEIASNEAIELLKIGTERETEAAYLGEQNRSSVVDEKLEHYRLQLEALLKIKEINSNEKIQRMNKVSGVNDKYSKSSKKISKEKVID